MIRLKNKTTLRNIIKYGSHSYIEIYDDGTWTIMGSQEYTKRCLVRLSLGEIEMYGGNPFEKTQDKRISDGFFHLEYELLPEIKEI